MFVAIGLISLLVYC